MRIVIVDDDIFISGALKTILETNEDVTVVGMGTDGGDAVVLYKKEKPDVLLMDIRMKEKMDWRRQKRFFPLTGRQGYFYLPHFPMMNIS